MSEESKKRLEEATAAYIELQKQLFGKVGVRAIQTPHGPVPSVESFAAHVSAATNQLAHIDRVLIRTEAIVTVLYDGLTPEQKERFETLAAESYEKRIAAAKETMKPVSPILQATKIPKGIKLPGG